jgi:hypothetical protein
MWLRAGMASTKGALLSRSSTAGWTRNSKGLLWISFSYHGWEIMPKPDSQGCSILNTHRSGYRFFMGFSQCDVMVAHGVTKTPYGANVALTSTVLFIASMPITAKLPVRPSNVTVSLCLGTRVSRLAISNRMQFFDRRKMVNCGH